MIAVTGTPTGRAPTEKEMVDTWIEERFFALGFTDVQATTLRLARADWHLAQKYLDQGCSHEHAATILT